MIPGGRTAEREIRPQQGTPEATWRRWPALERLTALPLGDARLVVIAPHPDDEVLMAAGLIARRASDQGATLVVAVTDGEASHPGLARWQGRTLAQVRRSERLAGLQELADPVPAFVTLDIADGGVAAAEALLRDRLRDLLQPGDLVVTTWSSDGHPDHEATGRAAQRVADERGATCLQAPVWMWNWAVPDDPRVPWQRLYRLELTSSEVRCKQAALSCHRSQLDAIEGYEPIVGADLVAQASRPFECFFMTE